MPPVLDLRQLCQNGSSFDIVPVSEEPLVTTIDPAQEEKDRQAVLYIVVVLLFYSLGIIVGIISYLKRERAELLEEKAYDDYISFREDPDSSWRSYKVQEAVAYLQKIETEKEEERQREKAKERRHSHPKGSTETKRKRLSIFPHWKEGDRTHLDLHLGAKRSVSKESRLSVAEEKEDEVVVPPIPSPDETDPLTAPLASCESSV